MRTVAVVLNCGLTGKGHLTAQHDNGNANHYFLYDSSNGRLSVDADASNPGAAVVLVTLTGARSFSVSDSVLVLNASRFHGGREHRKPHCLKGLWGFFFRPPHSAHHVRPASQRPTGAPGSVAGFCRLTDGNGRCVSSRHGHQG